MRNLCLLPLALALLANCGGTDDYTGLTCKVDGDCGNLKCGRDGTCAAPEMLQSVRVSWTINGQAASSATCAAFSKMALSFTRIDGTGKFGFDPIPCTAGLVTIDKIPNDIAKASISATKTAGGTAMGDSLIGASGDVAIDVK